jgi:rubredoxin
VPSTQTNTYQCDDCGFLYKPANFEGRDLSEQPDDFVCTDCQASKDHFQIYVAPPDDLQADADDPADELDQAPSGSSSLSSHGDLEVRRVYTDTGDQSVSSLKELYDEQDLDIRPGFQRYIVWTPTQQSRLVESVLLGLPIPRLYFAEDEDETQVVVDGQQRLAALFRFLDNGYPLQSLKALPELNGKKYRELSKKLRNRIKNFKLSTVLILKESEDDLRFDLYERLNTGSVGLNDQELRNSVHRGTYNAFVYELADYSEWRDLLNLKGQAQEDG